MKIIEQSVSKTALPFPFAMGTGTITLRTQCLNEDAWIETLDFNIGTVQKIFVTIVSDILYKCFELGLFPVLLEKVGMVNENLLVKTCSLSFLRTSKLPLVTECKHYLIWNLRDLLLWV